VIKIRYKNVQFHVARDSRQRSGQISGLGYISIAVSRSRCVNKQRNRNRYTYRRSALRLEVNDAEFQSEWGVPARQRLPCRGCGPGAEHAFVLEAGYRERSGTAWEKNTSTSLGIPTQALGGPTASCAPSRGCTPPFVIQRTARMISRTRILRLHQGTRRREHDRRPSRREREERKRTLWRQSRTRTQSSGRREPERGQVNRMPRSEQDDARPAHVCGGGEPCAARTTMVRP
jgi:hypothetical protein